MMVEEYIRIARGYFDNIFFLILQIDHLYRGDIHVTYTSSYSEAF